MRPIIIGVNGDCHGYVGTYAWTYATSPHPYQLSAPRSHGRMGSSQDSGGCSHMDMQGQGGTAE